MREKTRRAPRATPNRSACWSESPASVPATCVPCAAHRTDRRVVRRDLAVARPDRVAVIERAVIPVERVVDEPGDLRRARQPREIERSAEHCVAPGEHVPVLHDPPERVVAGRRLGGLLDPDDPGEGRDPARAGGRGLERVEAVPGDRCRPEHVVRWVFGDRDADRVRPAWLGVDVHRDPALGRELRGVRTDRGARADRGIDRRCALRRVLFLLRG